MHYCRARQPNYFFDFECASDRNDKHFLQKPIQLDCRHCICKECIPENEKIKCSFCGRITKSDLKECDVSVEKLNQIEDNYGQLFDETKQRFKLCYDKIKGKIFLYYDDLLKFLTTIFAKV